MDELDLRLRDLEAERLRPSPRSLTRATPRITAREYLRVLTDTASDAEKAVAAGRLRDLGAALDDDHIAQQDDGGPTDGP